MLNPALIESSEPSDLADDFWFRLLNSKQLHDCDDLEKLIIGCEIIAAWDTADLLAA